MTAKSATLPARLLRYLGYIVRLAVLAGIYALVLFYLNATATAADLDIPALPTKITIALIALGITGSIYGILVRIAAEVKGAIVVLADFLKTHLLEPREQRLREEGRAKGRAEGLDEGRAESRTETLAEVRSLLREQGFDLDQVTLPTDPKDAESTAEERC